MSVQDSKDPPAPPPQPLSYAQGNFPKPRFQRDARHIIALVFSIPFLLVGIPLSAGVVFGSFELLIHNGRSINTSELFRIAIVAGTADLLGLFSIVFYYRGE